MDVRKAKLLNGAANLREDVVGVGPDQANCADYDNENDGQHDGVFRDILAAVIVPQLLKKFCHTDLFNLSVSH